MLISLPVRLLRFTNDSFFLVNVNLYFIAEIYMLDNSLSNENLFIKPLTRAYILWFGRRSMRLPFNILIM
jgi:hypothetical protein